jgi:AcrR family transcriptional regulator
METLTRKPRSREHIADNIRQTAKTIARQDGWQAVSIRKIAEAVEYSAPVVYEYFVSKDALLASIRDEGFQHLLDEFGRIQKLYRDPEKRLFEISLCLWDYATTQSEMYDVMYNGNSAYCASPLNESQTCTAVGVLIREVLFSFIPKSKESLDKLYMEWWATTHGLISLALLLRPERQLANSELLYREVVRRFARSLRQ